jgi:hypothetical protein
MRSVLSFRPSPGWEVPTPVFYQPGDEYDLVELRDDSLLRAGFVKGCVFYVRVDYVLPGLPHLSLWRGGPRLGYVTAYHAHTLDWFSFDPRMPSSSYAHREAALVGAVVEIWSFGLGRGKPRWVYDESTFAWEAARPPLIQLAN